MLQRAELRDPRIEQRSQLPLRRGRGARRPAAPSRRRPDGRAPAAPPRAVRRSTARTGRHVRRGCDARVRAARVRVARVRAARASATAGATAVRGLRRLRGARSRARTSDAGRGRRLREHAPRPRRASRARARRAARRRRCARPRTPRRRARRSSRRPAGAREAPGAARGARCRARGRRARRARRRPAGADARPGSRPRAGTAPPERSAGSGAAAPPSGRRPRRTARRSGRRARCSVSCSCIASSAAAKRATSGLAGVERCADAHRGGDAAQHGGGGAEHREPLGADLGLATLERVRGVFRGLEDVGRATDDPSRRRCRACARTRRSTLAAASRSDGRVARSSAPAPMLATSVVRKPPSGAAGVARGRRGGAGRREARQLVDPGARAGVVGRAPRADVAQEELAVVDRRRRARRASAGSQRVAPLRSACPTRSIPAAISAKAGSLAIVALPRRARAERWSASQVGPARCRRRAAARRAARCSRWLRGRRSRENPQGPSCRLRSGEQAWAGHEVRPGVGRRPSPRAARARPRRARRRSRARSRDVRCSAPRSRGSPRRARRFPS